MRHFAKSAARLKGFDRPSIWSIITPLAKETQSIDLGEGAPAWRPPEFYISALTKALTSSNHQYARAFGLPHLCASILKYYSRFEHLNPLDNVIITAGAEGGIFCSLLALLNPGDEVIVFDPSYDSFRAQVQMAGGKTRGVSLKWRFQQTKQDILNRTDKQRCMSTPMDEWDIDWAGFEQALSQRTKVIILNSPHNPTGKIFSQSELEKIALLLRTFPQVVVIQDNAYESFKYDQYFGKPLPKLSFVEGMSERTLSVYSAGKLLANTGARVGWVIGPTSLIRMLSSVHYYDVFCLYEPIQSAIAQSLDTLRQENYLEEYLAKLMRNRKILVDSLLKSRFDFKLWIPCSGFFVLADIGSVQVKEKYFADEDTSQRRSRDLAFCIQLANECGVLGLPCSSFYDASEPSFNQNVIRFAFCRREEDIREAGRRLAQQ